MMAFGKWFAGWETEFTVSALVRLVEGRGARVVGVYGRGMSPRSGTGRCGACLLGLRVRLPMYPSPPRWIAATGRVCSHAVPERLRSNTALVIGCVARKK